MKQSKITALYSRLSRDDEAVGDSLSIKNQKAMLEKFAKEKGHPNPVHFVDDGFSGGNFERPDWKRMIDEIDNGNVLTVIAKDMSRVGRDYLQTGFYTEVYFREKGVRFIAVDNNIDSLNKASGEFAPFLNIMSEWYLRDVSRKVQNSHKAKGMSGERLTFKPIYGYMLDPNDRMKWIIDEEAAEVVRRIYALTIDSKGPVEIARIFQQEKIERPSYYMHRKGIVNYENTYDLTMPYGWGGSSISHIIEKPEYRGATVNFRTHKESYKDKSSKINPETEWKVFEDTHPAIVDAETWETAQRCRKTVRRTDSLGEANPLTGLVFCADCGAKLYNHRQPYPKTYVNSKGYTCTRHSRDVYACSTYNLSGRASLERKCTGHHIRTDVLRVTALEAIKAASGAVRENEAEFVAKLRAASAIRQEESAKACKQKIAQAQKKIAELDMLIKRTYEDNVSGKLSDKRYAALSGVYENEQAELEKTVGQLQGELDAYAADTDRTGCFIEIVRRHTDFSELTPAMIAEFIDKIVVHEADRSSGERKQKVDVYLNFIGKFEVEEPELTPEQIANEEAMRIKRQRSREAQKRYIARKKEAEAKAANNKKRNLSLPAGKDTDVPAPPAM